jgi:hypothetical protein
LFLFFFFCSFFSHPQEWLQEQGFVGSDTDNPVSFEQLVRARTHESPNMVTLNVLRMIRLVSFFFFLLRLCLLKMIFSLVLFLFPQLIYALGHLAFEPKSSFDNEGRITIFVQQKYFISKQTELVHHQTMLYWWVYDLISQHRYSRIVLLLHLYIFIVYFLRSYIFYFVLLVSFVASKF